MQTGIHSRSIILEKRNILRLNLKESREGFGVHTQSSGSDVI